MVSTRSSRLSASSATPVPATPQLPSSGRILRSQRTAERRPSVSTSIVNSVISQLIEEEPHHDSVVKNEESMSSSGASVRRKDVGLSQITARSRGQGEGFYSQHVPASVEVDDSEDEETQSVASPEPGASKAPRSAQVQPSQVSSAGELNVGAVEEIMDDSSELSPDSEPYEDSQIEGHGEKQDEQHAPAERDHRTDSESENPNASRNGHADSHDEKQADAQEDEELAEIRKACLDDLGRATKKLVDTLYNPTLPPSVRNKLGNVNRKVFQDLRNIYEDDNVPFIDIHAVLSSLGAEINPSAPRILCQANLAKLLDALASADDPIRLVNLAKLLDDVGFPEPFQALPDPDDFDLDAVSHAMDIRIQRFIGILAGNAGMRKPFRRQKLLKWAAGVFCGGDDGVTGGDVVEANMADICGIAHPLPAPIAKLCFSKLTELLDKAQGSTLPSIIEALRKAYPVHKWRDSLKDYAYADFFAMDDSAPPSRAVSEELGARSEEMDSRSAEPEPRPNEQLQQLEDRPDEAALQPDDGSQDEVEVEAQPDEEPENEAEVQSDEELEDEQERAPVAPLDRDGSQASAAPSTAASQPIAHRLEPDEFDDEMVSFLAAGSPPRQTNAAPAADLAIDGSAFDDDLEDDEPDEEDEDYAARLAHHVKARLVLSQQGRRARPPPSSSRAPLPRANGRKRPRVKGEEDEGEDSDETDDFEQDLRRPDEERRRKLNRRNMPPPPLRKRQKRDDPPRSQSLGGDDGAPLGDAGDSPAPRHPQTYHAPPASAPGTRPRPRLIVPRGIDDDDDDDPFTDSADERQAQQQNNKPPPASAPVKRSHARQVSPDPFEDADESPVQQRQNNVQPPSTAPANRSVDRELERSRQLPAPSRLSHTASELAHTPAPAVVDYAAIRDRNRRAQETRQPQHRIPWSNADVDKLIKYIADYHCAWAIIYEKANPVRTKKNPERPAPPFDPDRHFSVERTQQQIRDKARNLKVDFLKADLVLPMGFDGIALGPKEKVALKARRKNPARLEKDITSAGVPTNTFYDE